MVNVLSREPEDQSLKFESRKGGRVSARNVLFYASGLQIEKMLCLRKKLNAHPCSKLIMGELVLNKNLHLSKVNSQIWVRPTLASSKLFTTKAVCPIQGWAVK